MVQMAIPYTRTVVPYAYTRTVSEENRSARKICPGGHIFLGNSVLPDRIYCPP